MARLELKNINKIYPDGAHIIKDANLTIEDGEFTVFVGPSGCGKSTMLRMVAGLEEISSGDMCLDGEVVNNLSPTDRGIGMVFQSYALYPHMTVYENIAFGLKLAKKSKDDIDSAVRQVAEMLELTNLLKQNQVNYRVVSVSAWRLVVRLFAIRSCSYLMSRYLT